MLMPIVCLDGRLGQFAATFAGCFSAPRRQHLVTVLLVLLLCREPRTLSGLGRQVVERWSVAARSRFLGMVSWSRRPRPPSGSTGSRPRWRRWWLLSTSGSGRDTRVGVADRPPPLSPAT